eukprot:4795015-Prymnesium_polylepis.1
MCVWRERDARVVCETVMWRERCVCGGREMYGTRGACGLDNAGLQGAGGGPPSSGGPPPSGRRSGVESARVLTEIKKILQSRQQ